MKIESFKEIAQQYKVLFFDSYGVLKNYNGLIEGVPRVLQEFQEEGKPYFVLTNDASRSPKQLVKKFHKIGLPQVREEVMVTSGMMAQEYLKYKVRTGKVVFLGTEHAAHYIEAVGLEPIPIDEFDETLQEEIAAFLFLDDEGFDWKNAINVAINLLNERNIPVIVANSDSVYPISKRRVSLATGGISEVVEAVVDKHFIHFGKPDSQMFMYAYEQLLLQQQIEKSEILMVGDTLYTDILGGNKFGLDTALVLTGNTHQEHANFLINKSGIIPNYICRSIAQ